MHAIFLYGSLMDPEVRQYVFADSISDRQIQPARAQNFQTFTYPGETFPVLSACEGYSVEGEVLLSPSPEALERMAFYEGDEYGMASLEVQLNSGQQLLAHYNQANDESLPLTDIWCFRRWQQTERDTLVQMCKRYMERCWGKMTIEQADLVWQELQALRA